MCLQIIYLIYMYEEDLTLNNLQWLIYHKTQPILIWKIFFNWFKYYKYIDT